MSQIGSSISTKINYSKKLKNYKRQSSTVFLKANSDPKKYGMIAKID